MLNPRPNPERRSKKLKSALSLERMPGLVATLSSRGDIEHLNPQLLGYLGAQADGLKNWTDGQLIHPEDVPRVSNVLADPPASGELRELECRVRRSDGQYRWFQGCGLCVRDGDGGIPRWYLLLTDIDDRKRLEARLRQTEALLGACQGLSSTGTFSWSVQQDALVWSAQLYRTLDIDPSVPATMALLEARVHPADLAFFRDSIGRARETRDDFEYDLRLRPSSDGIKYLHVVAHATEDPVFGLEYLGVVQDVTERRRADQLLAKARMELSRVNRIMSLGALSASIAHEINQPLSGIITNANTCLRMLAAAPPNLDGARETARRTIRAGNRAAEVTARLRALYSHKKVGAEAIDLNEVVQDVVALSLADLRKNRVLVRQELADDLPFVSGDPVQLQQVVLNLLLNAGDAMSSVDDRPRQLVIRTERDESDQVRLTVRDSGVGFEPSQLEQLFEPFYTTKTSGMGIGLSVSRWIVESHGGQLCARPNHGPGATFTLSLPRLN
jgi:PAS domain S-box-containing protein